jgi:hypothetical protein
MVCSFRGQVGVGVGMGATRPGNPRDKKNPSPPAGEGGATGDQNSGSACTSVAFTSATILRLVASAMRVA